MGEADDHDLLEWIRRFAGRSTSQGYDDEDDDVILEREPEVESA